MICYWLILRSHKHIPVHIFNYLITSNFFSINIEVLLREYNFSFVS